MLKHLVLIPQYGLCNRLCAIASARRICQIYGARLTVQTDWVNFNLCFKEYHDIEWNYSPHPPTSYYKIRHLSSSEGGYPANQFITTAKERIVLKSGYLFRAQFEDCFPLEQLKPWFVEPCGEIALDVEDLMSRRLPCIGVHIRRGDNQLSIKDSPDDLFTREMMDLVDHQGKRVLICTDSKPHQDFFTIMFKDKAFAIPKTWYHKERWPRVFSLEETREDMVDLYSLARCEYVIGSSHSSFTDMAKTLNGSRKCKKLIKSAYP